MGHITRIHCAGDALPKPVTTIMTRYTPTSAPGLQDGG